MKILYPINQHFVIWSFLCGDHALKSNISLLDKRIITTPDLLSPIQNELRWEIFKSKRNWIADEMGDRASFALGKISIDNLKKYDTCFENICFHEFVNEYREAYINKRDMVNDRSQHFLKRHYKPFSSVKYEFQLKQKLVKNYKNIKEKDVLDISQRNDQNLSIALNRCFIMKKGDKNIIMDGMHRLSAYYWSKVFDNEKKLPKEVFCFFWEAKY
jgi:hypothetical protein